MPFGPNEAQDRKLGGKVREAEKEELKQAIKEKVQIGQYDESLMPNDSSLRHLCGELMTLDVNGRLGVDGGYPRLKAHAAFAELDWGRLSAGLLPAPISPQEDAVNAPSSMTMDLSKFDEFKKKKVAKQNLDGLVSQWPYLNRYMAEVAVAGLVEELVDMRSA